MKIIHFPNYTILELERFSKSHTLIDFLSDNQDSCPHVIIDIMKSSLDNHTIVEKLLPFHLNWEKRNKSFILVSILGKESLKGLISLRSKEEAVDFFHMEELTRTI
tara:strand:- start:269 stop:586 length:318 start_codon:yes stop_codon:yes gene_type:complete